MQIAPETRVDASSWLAGDRACVRFALPRAPRTLIDSSARLREQVRYTHTHEVRRTYTRSMLHTLIRLLDVHCVHTHTYHTHRGWCSQRGRNEGSGPLFEAFLLKSWGFLAKITWRTLNSNRVIETYTKNPKIVVFTSYKCVCV